MFTTLFVQHLFQFALPHGERLYSLFLLVILSRFQFALPHGERPILKREWEGFSISFNSRSRMGSDRTTRRVAVGNAGFNSRSRMGSDSMACAYGIRLRSFNSRSRMGSDGTIRR